MYLIQIRIRCLGVEYTLIIIQPTFSSRKLLKCGPFKDLCLVKDLLDIAWISIREPMFHLFVIECVRDIGSTYLYIT